MIHDIDVITSLSILAAYDLGAPAAQLKKMYDEEDKDQRPKYVQKGDESIVVTRDNWVQYLSNERSAEHLILLRDGKLTSGCSS